MVVDFRWSSPPLLPVSIEGVNVEMVRPYKYLGLYLYNKLDWSSNTEPLYRKGQNRLYFLRRLGSLNIIRKLLMIYCSSLSLPVSSFMLWCAGEAVLRRETLDDCTNW